MTTIKKCFEIIEMDVYIIGCGGNSKVVVDICELNRYQILGIFDDKYCGNTQTLYKNYPLIGNLDDIFKYDQINLINSIGDNAIRERIYQKLKKTNLNWINCIHPNAFVSPTAKLGMGNIVCYGAFINSDAQVGNFNLINTYAIIEHDCLIHDFNHLAPRTTLCGSVNIGNLNLVGAATTIIPGKKIGNHNIIGASTVIINDFDDQKLLVGIPAKIKK